MTSIADFPSANATIDVGFGEKQSSAVAPLPNGFFGPVEALYAPTFSPASDKTTGDLKQPDAPLLTEDVERRSREHRATLSYWAQMARLARELGMKPNRMRGSRADIEEPIVTYDH